MTWKILAFTSFSDDFSRWQHARERVSYVSPRRLKRKNSCFVSEVKKKKKTAHSQRKFVLVRFRLFIKTVSLQKCLLASKVPTHIPLIFFGWRVTYFPDMHRNSVGYGNPEFWGCTDNLPCQVLVYRKSVEVLVTYFESFGVTGPHAHMWLGQILRYSAVHIWASRYFWEWINVSMTCTTWAWNFGFRKNSKPVSN